MRRRFSRKLFIDDVYDHYAEIRSDAHLFDPERFVDFLTFDKPVFNVDFSYVTHKMVVLALLQAECAKLRDETEGGEDADPKFVAETYGQAKERFREDLFDTINSRRLENVWKRLFWGSHSFACQKKSTSHGGEIVCVRSDTSDSNEYAFHYYAGVYTYACMTKCYRRSLSPNFEFVTADMMKGKARRCVNQQLIRVPWEKGHERKCLSFYWDDFGNCWKSWKKRKNPSSSFRVSCGSSARRMYLKSATWL